MPIGVFKCDYCRDTFPSMWDATRHEEECVFFPENRACYTCGNMKDYSVAMCECMICAVNANRGSDEMCPGVMHCESWIPETTNK